MSRRRRRGRWAIVVAAVFAGIVALLLLLQSPPVARRVLRTAAAGMEGSGIALRAGRLRYNLPLGRVVLEDVSLSALGTPAPPFLQADRAFVRPDVGSILRGRIRLRDLELAGVRLRILTDAQGRSNLPKSTGPPKPPPPFVLDRIRVRGLDFEMRNAATGLAVVMPGLRADGEWVAAKSLHRLAVTGGRPGSLRTAALEAPLTDLRVRAWFDNVVMILDDVAVDVGRSRIQTSGRIDNYLGAPSLRGRFDVLLDPTLLLRGRAGAPKVSGSLRVRGEAAQGGGTASVRARVDGQGLEVEGLGPVGLGASVSLDEDRLRVSDLVVRAAGGEAAGSAEASLAPAFGGTAALTLADFDPRTILAFLGLDVPVATRLGGALQGRFSGRGLRGIAGDATLRLRSAAGGPKSVPISGAISGSAAGGGLRVEVRDLALPGLSASASGAWNGKMISASYSAASPDLSSLERSAKSLGRLRSLPALAGRLAARGTVSGTLSAPVVSAELSGEALAGFGLRDAALSARGSWRPAGIALDALTLAAGGGTVEASGTIGPAPARPLDLRVRGDGVAMATIAGAARRVPLPSAGSLGFSGRIVGPASKPTASLDGRAVDVAWRGQRFDSVEFGADIDPRRAVLRRLHAVAGPGALDASGSWELRSRRFAAKVAADRFPIEGLDVPGGQGLLRGDLDLRADAEGTPDRPRVTAAGALRGAALGERELGDVRFDASTEGETLAASLAVPSLTADLKATLGLRPPRPLKATLALAGLTLGRVAGLAPIPSVLTAAALAGTASVSGELDRLSSTLAVDADVSALSAEVRGRGFRADAPFAVSYRPGGVSVRGLALSGEGLALRASGSLARRGAGGPGLRLEGSVDLAALGVFSKKAVVEGRLTLSAAVGGSLERPVPSGSFAISGARLGLAAGADVVENGVVKLELARNVIRLETLSFDLAGGSLAANGSLPLAVLSPSVARRFPSSGGSGRFSAKLVEFDLTALMAALGHPAPETIRGVLAGDVGLEFARPALDAVAGTLDFPTLDLGFYGYRVTAARPIQAAIRGGRLEVTSFSLGGPDFRLDVTGGLSLEGDRPLDLRAAGEVGFRPLGIPGVDLQITGTTTFDVAARGPAAGPAVEGRLTLRDMGARMAQPGLLVDGLNGDVLWTGGRLSTPGLFGAFNGGTAAVAGGAEMSGFRAVAADVTLALKGVSLEIPPGLLTQSDAELRFASSGGSSSLSGTVTIAQGQYKRPFDPASGLLGLLRRSRPASFTATPSPLQSKLALSVRVITGQPLVVDNNLAHAEATADVRLTGTPLRPGLTGQATLLEGSEITLNQRKFLVESARVAFLDADRIVPDVDVNASTQLKGYIVTLTASGTPDDLTANLTSDPPLSEPSIVSMLLTGRILDNTTASTFNAAGDVTLAFLGQSLAGRLGNFAASALGLQSVRIDTGLISPETQPTARVSVTESLARDLDLTLSMNLRDAQNRAWLLDYSPTRFLGVQGVKTDNNVYGLAVQNELRFGPGRDTAPAKRRPGTGPVVRSVEISGETGVPAARFRREFRNLAGKPFDFFRLWKDRENARALLVRAGFLQLALDTARRDVADGTVVEVRVRAGPAVRLEYAGAAVPRRLRREIEDQWAGGLFSPWAVARIAERVRAHFVGEKRYQAVVRARADFSAPSIRRFRFEITPGPAYSGLDLLFSGNAALTDADLRAVVREARVETELVTEPRKAMAALEGAYRKRGFLAAAVRETAIEYRPEARRAVLAIKVEEGPRFRVGEVRVVGARALDPPWVRATAGLQPGEVFLPDDYNDAAYRLESAYGRLGFNEARADATAEVRPEGDVDVTLTVKEGTRDRLAEIRISGNRLTRPDIVRRMLSLKRGDIIAPSGVNESRKYLLNLGVFTRVDLFNRPLEAAPAGAGTASPPDAGPPGRPQPNVLRVELAEIRPWRFRYGGHYSTDTGPGVTAELTNFNVAGLAFLAGARLRLDRDLQDLRAYARSPYFLKSRDLHTDLFAFAQHSSRLPFRVDLAGFTVQQQLQIRVKNILTYSASYQWERSTAAGQTGAEPGVTPIPGQPPPAAIPGLFQYLDLNGAYTLDTRNDILNAVRGAFLSQSVEAIPGLFARLRMARTYSQAFLYVPLRKLTFATGARLGLGWSSAGLLTPSKRFLAGGGNTVRGFGRDELGPHAADGTPTGGNAVVILNNELRFPILGPVGGVVFVDSGNVFARIRDLGSFRLRTAVGGGLRFQNPYVVVALDYGFKLARRRGEPSGALSFTLGQAF